MAGIAAPRVGIDLIPPINAANVQDPELQARIPEVNSDIDEINKSLREAVTLIHELGGCHGRLDARTFDKAQWPQLEKDYLALQGRVRKFTDKLKPEAQKRINKLPTRYEGIDGIDMKQKLDTVSTNLSKKNQDVLNRINTLVHDNQIEFPAPHKCPDPSSFSWVAQGTKFASNNAGWIFTGVAATTALLTLIPPLGKMVGSHAADLPEQLGDLCHRAGKFGSDLLKSPPVMEALKSPRMKTLGWTALHAVPLYPAYRYFKEPVQKFVKGTIDVTDIVVTHAAKYPVVTFLAVYGASYVVSSATNFEPRIEKHFGVEPYWVRGVFAGATVGTVHVLKEKIAAYKKTHPASAPAGGGGNPARAGNPIGGQPPIPPDQMAALAELAAFIRQRNAAQAAAAAANAQNRGLGGGPPPANPAPAQPAANPPP